MKNTLPLIAAHMKVRELLVLGGDPQPAAVALGRSLSWKWPTDMNPYEAMRLSRLCDLLNVNLPGRPREVR